MTDETKDKPAAKPAVDGTSKVKTEYVQINNSFDKAGDLRPIKGSSGGSGGSGGSGTSSNGQ